MTNAKTNRRRRANAVINVVEPLEGRALMSASPFGQPVTLTATVTPTAPAVTAGTGHVTSGHKFTLTRSFNADGDFNASDGINDVIAGAPVNR